METRAFARQRHPVALVEIGDGGREWRERESVGAEIDALVAPADGERRTAPRADQKIVFALEKKGERKGALEPLQRRRDGFFRRRAIAQLVGDEMGDGLGVGLARKDMAFRRQLGAQLAEIFDDAIMNHRDAVVGVRMGVVLGGAAMRRPARVADADGAGERRGGELFFEVLELAARPHTGEPPVLQSGDPGRNHSPDIRDA